MATKQAVTRQQRPARRRGRRTGQSPSNPARAPRWARSLLPLLGLGLLALVGQLSWALLPGPGAGAPRLLELPEAEPQALAAQLHAQGMINSPLLFRSYLALSGVSVTAGPHLVRDGLSARELVRLLGRLPRRPQTRLLIPEGWNLYQVAQRLETQRVCSSQAFTQIATDPELLSQLNISGPSAEGYLFPATYRLHLNSHPEVVLRRLVKEAQRRLAQLLDPEARAELKRRAWSEHELLTFASMVEKEAARASERPLIASVFLNRLSQASFTPRKLQSDPTSAYGCYVQPERIPSCRGFRGHISGALNRDPANLYSTYVHEGLPPGPIANPGLAALVATLKPAHSEYLYFVARGDGGHIFSVTYAQHRAALGALRR